MQASAIIEQGGAAIDPPQRRFVHSAPTALRAANSLGGLLFVPNTQATHATTLPTGTTLGDRYTIEQQLRVTSFGTLFRAIDSSTASPVSIHCLSPELRAKPSYVEALHQAVARASQVTHPNVTRTLGVGTEGSEVFVVSEHQAGHTLSELLERKKNTGSAFSPKQVSNISASLSAAVEACGKVGGHGAVTLESVVVDKTGSITLTDLGLGILAPALGDTLGARLSPELHAGGAPTSQADVYGVGAIVYELLVGVAPSPGCRRPSEVVPTLSSLVDQFVGATTNPDPDKRPALGQIGPAAQKALASASMTMSQQELPSDKPQRPSLAQAITEPTKDTSARPSQTHTSALMGAMAQTHDRWLVTKGKLDYGPFPLAAIVEQIKSNQIVPGNVLVDNETGNRSKVENNPLLADLVETARQKRDDERRANAEVAHAKQERSRGAAVYVIIAVAVLGIGGGGYLAFRALSAGDDASGSKQLALDEGSLEAKISFPSKEQASKRRKKHRKRGSGSGGKGGAWDDSLNFDMAGGDVGSDTLNNSQVNPVIQRSGGKLGGCLRRTKTSNAFIEFMIKGTGKVYQVRVNGSTSTPVAKCLRGVMFSMKFPSFNGQRSKHNFDLGF